MIHLTETGPYAGARLCETNREDGEQNVHAANAPLHSAEFRAKACPACLKVWATLAYEDGDEMPEWVREVRSQ